MEGYVCAFCGREHVKLWRPYMGTEPLICAICAEERQSTRKHEEVTWRKEGDHYIGTPTGKLLTLPKWTVNEKGRIPSMHGPGPDGIQLEMTDQLIINFKENSESWCTMVPAVPDENGDFWGYTAVPDEGVKWWRNLPTR